MKQLFPFTGKCAHSIILSSVEIKHSKTLRKIEDLTLEVLMYTCQKFSPKSK